MLLNLVVVKCSQSGGGSKHWTIVYAPLTVSKQISVIFDIFY